ncbi:MAG: flavodoxin family protein, partial [Alphaproteobacteria bacterium]
MTAKPLLIVAHAPSPNTRRLFDAVVEGARSDETSNLEVVAQNPFETGPEEVLAAGAIILGTT